MRHLDSGNSASYTVLDKGSISVGDGDLLPLWPLFQLSPFSVQGLACEEVPQFPAQSDHQIWDLKDADLRRGDAGIVDLHGADLRGVDLRGAWLRRANLREACLARADLTEARLLDANMEWARLPGAQLSRACLTGANLRGANLWRANLKGADLKYAWLRSANLCEARLEEANLVGADLREADMRRAALAGAFLDRAKLSSAQLTYRSFGRGVGEELVGEYARARDIYRALQDVFESLGQQEDAHWAHQKESRMAWRGHGQRFLPKVLYGKKREPATLSERGSTSRRGPEGRPRSDLRPLPGHPIQLAFSFLAAIPLKQPQPL